MANSNSTGWRKGADLAIWAINECTEPNDALSIRASERDGCPQYVPVLIALQ